MHQHFGGTIVRRRDFNLTQPVDNTVHILIRCPRTTGHVNTSHTPNPQIFEMILSGECLFRCFNYEFRVAEQATDAERGLSGHCLEAAFGHNWEINIYVMKSQLLACGNLKLAIYIHICFV